MTRGNNMPRCATCRYVRRDPMVKTEGECRRFPPVLIPVGPRMDGTMGSGSACPQVDLKEDWCGEHEPLTAKCIPPIRRPS